MWRRTFLVATAAGILQADPRQEVYDLFASMANGLSESNAQPFLAGLDPRMPGYQKLVADVQALVQQVEVLSSIDVIQDSGDDQHRTLQLDWSLRLTPKADTTATQVRRQQMIRCELEKQKKRWRVVSMEPAGFFAPPRP
jgi:hypothetical protein